MHLTDLACKVPAVRRIRDHCYGTPFNISPLRVWYGTRMLTPVAWYQNDFPQLKYALLGGLGLLALIQRE